MSSTRPYRLPVLVLLPIMLLLAACSTSTFDEQAALPHPIGQTQLRATIQVPGDYATIADALAAAAIGDVVQVAAGTWVGDLTLPGGVTLQGSGIDQTIIEGHITVSGGQAGLYFLNVVGPGTSANTCGVDVGPGNSIVALSMRVLSFHQGFCLNPGIILSVPWPLVDRVTLQSNAYGIAVYSGQATVTNSYFAYQNRSGVWGFDNATVTAVNNSFVANSFGGNEADRDAALSLGEGGASLVRNNSLTNNLFGLQCDSCVATMDHNNVWGNTTNYAGDSASHFSDLSLDPLYVGISTGNLRLQDVSPLIDAGTSDGAPDHDWDGLPRPSGAAWDIGADEWSLSAYTLVINEVMSNASTENTGEFIEIANVGSEPMELAGLVISDGDSDDTIEAYNSGTTIVPAGGYAVVLDPDYATDYPTMPSGAITVTVGDARLGNGLSTNDPIQLLEDNGYVVIDEWTIPFNPGDGVSVERVDVLSGNIVSNWVPSSCASGSSPGEGNCSAGEIAPNDPSVLVITEVMANPLIEQSGEYVELWNSGADDVDLTGLVIDDGDSNDGLIAWGGGDTVLVGGAVALIVDPNYAANYLIPNGVVLMTTDDATIGNGLANATDPVTLFDLDGVTVIDSYSFPADYGNGISVEKGDYAVGDLAANWDGSSCGNSAGRLSCNAGGIGAGVIINEVMSNPLNEQTGEFIELRNLAAGAIDLNGLWISDGDAPDQLVPYDTYGTVIDPDGFALIVDPDYNGEFVIPAGIPVLTSSDYHLGNGLSLSDPITLYESDGASIIDTWWGPFNAGNGTSVEKVNPWNGDVSTNWEAASCASGSSAGLANCASYIPIPSGTTTLTITEILSNPENEATGEYVEVYNHGSAPVEMWGLVFYDGDAWDYVRELSGPTVVDPGEYALILDSGYASQYAIPAGVTVVTVDDSTLGSGLATSDPVTLYEADGYSVIDTFSFPFNPGNGISVERVDITVDDIEANWVESSCLLSPGVVNCSASTSITACDDGIDNDLDGWIDLVDPGCVDAADNDEFFAGANECNDEFDNDGDGLVDGQDPDCTDPTDPTEGTPCANGLDDDGDGWTDLDDPDCSTGTEELGFWGTQCNDDADNDGDGFVDAADPDCSDGFADMESADCSDGVDNDGDSWIDLLDPECSELGAELGPGWWECNDGIDNDTDGLIDALDPECDDGFDGSETSADPDDCSDGADNDGDGWIDALDIDCSQVPYDEIFADGGTECSDGVDNDGDGLADSIDPDCTQASDAYEAPDCYDGFDNDGDGWTDWNDADCVQTPWGEVGYTGVECNDGFDNDGDGFVDADDPYCYNGWGGSESDIDLDDCSDGVDNDGDGWLDWNDPECAVYPFDETGVGTTQCNDGIDNDGDGVVDNDDPDCIDANDDIEAGACANGLDDDGDGWTDGDDPECIEPEGATETGTSFWPDCNDGDDNDGDGFVDADDPECDDGYDDDEASAAADDCFDGLDNDGDGWTDGLDNDCQSAPFNEIWASTWYECGNGADDDGDGLADELDPDCLDGGQQYEAPSCFDGLDNDADGWVDSQDPDCVEMPWSEVGLGVTECNDGADNDADGMVDFADVDCWDGMDGSESDGAFDDCMDGIDNDGDGWIDGIDPDCIASPFDELGVGTVECNDGVDNDGDGGIDALDADCSGPDDILEQAGCTNGIDDDGDGWTDADDVDCYVGGSDETNTTDWLNDCSNGADDDGDGLVDSDDPECDYGMDGDEASADVDDCFDGIDNDGDGWTDIDDPDCPGGAVDESWTTSWHDCNDGLDNDGDGFVDGDDPSCTTGTDSEGVALGTLLVTEVMNNPATVSDANGEWFELHNTGWVDVDIEGWQISDLGSDSFTVGGSLVVPAFDYIVLTRNVEAVNGGVTPDYVYGSAMALSNGEDEIVLTDPTGFVSVNFAYDEAAGWPNTNGESMAFDGNLAPDATSVAGPGNWCPATMPWPTSDGDNGSPAMFNDPC
jgi:hypothetical protein